MSRTVTTERSLEALCHEQARERLGQDAGAGPGVAHPPRRP